VYNPLVTMQLQPNQGYMTQDMDHHSLRISEMCTELMLNIWKIIRVRTIDTVAFQYQLLLSIDIHTKMQSQVQPQTVVNAIVHEFLTELEVYFRHMYHDVRDVRA
jgi:hypothetical protein